MGCRPQVSIFYVRRAVQRALQRAVQRAANGVRCADSLLACHAIVSPQGR